MIRILLAEDQKLFLNALQKVVEDDQDIEIVGYCNHGDKVVDSVRQLQPDVLLLDINMPGQDGVSIAEQLKKIQSEVKILIFTSYSSELLVNELYALGIEGFLLKTDDIEVFFEAIHSVFRGEKFYSDEVKSLIHTNSEHREQNFLTAREIEIIKFICQGLSTSEIASRLHISPLTVETHRKNINHKLNIKHFSELIKYAVQRGLASG